MWQQIETQRTSWGQGCSPTFVVNSLLLRSNSASTLHVLDTEWLYKYGNVFSKHKSERMPLWKLYDYAIDFMEGTKLSKYKDWVVIT